MLATFLISAPAAKADCPAAPLASIDDMVVSFLASQGGTQIGPSTIFASSVKEGMLVYDNATNALKLCDGTTWTALGSGGGATVAGTVAGAVQFRGGTAVLAADDANLVWDDTNNRLGIGTAAPSVRIEVLPDAGGNILKSVGTGATVILQQGGVATNILASSSSVPFNFGTGGGSTIAGSTVNLVVAGGAALTAINGGNVGIGTGTPNASALLDVTSTTKGFLPPRMTTAQVTAVATPADGLIVYDTDTDTIKLRANGAWVSLQAGAGAESDPQVGTLTASKWCAANVGGTAIDCTADAPATGAAGAASEVQFRNSSTGAFAADSTLVWDDTNNRLGVGTASPQSQFHLYNSATAYTPQAIIENQVADASPGYLLFRKGRGGTTTPSASDTLGSVSFQARDTGGAWRNAAYISALAGTAGATYVPSYLSFSTTSNAGVTGQHMTIDNAGSVGIGTTAPASKLHVYGSAGTALFKIESNDGPALTFFGNNGGGWIETRATGNFWKIDAPAQLGFFNGASEKVRIDTTTGSVGIGTSSPAPTALLDITSTTKGFLPPRMTTAQVTAVATPADGLIVYDTDTDTIKLRANGAWVSMASGSSAASGAAGYLQISGGSGAFASSSTTAGQQLFWDTTNHRLGIGTAVPTRTLDVTSAGSTGVHIAAGGTGQWAELTLRNSNAVANAKIWGLANNGSTQNLQFRTLDDDNASNPAVVMALTRTGNVGIGTATPFARLDVYGIGTGATVASSGTTDATTNARISRGVVGADIGILDNGTGYLQNRNITNFATNYNFVLQPNGGNVGIGTTAPGAKIEVEVVGAAQQADGLLIDYPSGYPTTAAFSITMPAYAGSSRNLIQASSGASGSNFVVRSDGNVGIGTTAPEAKFMVAGGNGAPSLTGDPGIINFTSNTSVQLTGGVENASPYAFWLQTKQSTDSGVAWPLSLNPLGGGVVLASGGGSVGIGGVPGGQVGSAMDVIYDGAGTEYGIELRATANNTWPLWFTNAGGTAAGGVSMNAGGTAVAYNTSSDKRLKENISATTRGLEALMKIEVDEFNFITDPGKERVQGFIAQQLNEVYPEAVTVGGDDVKTQPWTVDYGRLTPLLVKSIQELKAANDNLATENAELREALEALRGRVDNLEYGK